ncbi:MAG: hypothetical protein M3O61_16085 [Gemmatimonadota bacterium]|nr:hypothetical protein [Gemmatimonadota bacterium]
MIRQTLGHALAAALGIAPLGACRDVAPAFGPNAAAGRANADGLFGGIAQRFTNVQRSPKFTVARTKLGKNALTPSVIYNDTSVWTAWGADSTRVVTIDGEFSGNRYLFTARPSPATPPNEPGDSRHYIRLRRLNEDVFEWVTNVDIAAGSIKSDEFANVISRLMGSAEGRTPGDVRADYRSSFPRTTSALGRLFSLDTLRTIRDNEGATTVLLGIRLNPNGIRATMPDFAKYLDKYAAPARYRAVVTDRRGGRWIEFAGSDNYMTLRVRSLNGHVAPLNGPVRPIPNDLQLTSDFTTKILFFTVGFRALTGDVTVVNSDRERGWFMRFTREPDWRLPSAVSVMIHTPLRKPFEGSGATFRLVLRDNPGAQSLISRRSATLVQESAILRFLGRLGSTAMGDFVGKSEVQENRFSAEVCNALRLDIRALLP